MAMRIGFLLTATVVFTAPLCSQEVRTERRTFELRETILEGTGVSALQGTFDVFENRAAGEGRVIGLNVVLLPATGPDPKPDPVFLMAGGPGQAATTLAGRVASSWMRNERDIVLVDQRGTGASNPLHCFLSDDFEGLQGFLEPTFQPELFRDCLEQLREQADLTQYSTPIAMDDLDEVREALGYERINIMGGSYGTRATLIYMQRHCETVRTAVLRGVAPTSMKNPLHHARGAQRSLDLVLDACASDPACSQAFPELEEELEAILTRLAEEPAKVTITDRSGDTHELSLSREAFGSALRVMLYYSPSARRVPLLLHRAYHGDFEPFVNEGIRSTRGLRETLAFGMLLCVTCAEDVARIDEDEVEPMTAGSFFGDQRVRAQIETCSFWPQGELPENYTEPVTCAVPTLVISGTFDPVTPPAFGEEVAGHLPRATHVVVPRAHDLGGPCIEELIRQVLERGSVEDLDTSCVDRMPAIRFELAD